jgi:Mn2+/Fe2+ NRAMP family transporter
MVELSIVHVAAGVFIGNVCTLVVVWCWKEFHNPDEKKIPALALSSFVIILGLVVLLLAGQKLG